MTYAIVNSGVVVNMIAAEPDIAEKVGALPFYEGCRIGGLYAPSYNPTALELCEQHITDLELDSIAMGQQITELELLILEGGNTDV